MLDEMMHGVTKALSLTGLHLYSCLGLVITDDDDGKGKTMPMITILDFIMSFGHFSRHSVIYSAPCQFHPNWRQGRPAALSVIASYITRC